MKRRRQGDFLRLAAVALILALSYLPLRYGAYIGTTSLVCSTTSFPSMSHLQGRNQCNRNQIVMMSSSSSDFNDPEPEGTRVEEALRVTTKQIKALQRLVDSFNEIPPPSDPPQFPPANVEFSVPTRESTELDKMMIRNINERYYDCLNKKDVKGILQLWRDDEQVQMYANEDKIVIGREEIDKYFDGKFRNTWATNKHTRKMDVHIEDERIFLRGINAFMTNKEVWEHPKTKEKKVMFSTKILTKSNGQWGIVHMHQGDGSQIEVSSNGQMKLTDSLRTVGGASLQQGQQQPQQLGQNSMLGNLLGSGSSAEGFTADGREIRTIVTPEGYRIILGGAGGQGGIQGIQGTLGGSLGGAQQRSGQETKEALLKALIQDLSKNGKGDIIPLQLGSRNGGQGGGFLSPVSSSSFDGQRGNRRGNDGGENLTRKTVAAVRQLCVDGRISVEQKQKLIFSVIRSTKAEEISQVEMAYDLLVENALAGEENAMDEFADQCRIITERFEEEEDDDEEEYDVFDTEQ